MRWRRQVAIGLFVDIYHAEPPIINIPPHVAVRGAPRPVHSAAPRLGGHSVIPAVSSLARCHTTRHTPRNHEEARGGPAYGKRRKISDPAAASVEHAGCHSSKCFLLHLGVLRLCFDLHGVRPLLSPLGAVAIVLRRGCVPVLQRLDRKPKVIMAVFCCLRV